MEWKIYTHRGGNVNNNVGDKYTQAGWELNSLVFIRI